MRRFPAIVLLLVAFSLSLLAPLLAAGTPKKLPACCRRDGNHHCARNRAHTHNSGVSISSQAVCPLFPPGLSAAVSAPAADAPPVFNSIHRSTAAVPAPPGQPFSLRPIEFALAGHKRGPPSPVTP
jgi:hypothetical protein